jgi:hypothetical protein
MAKDERTLDEQLAAMAEESNAFELDEPALALKILKEGLPLAALQLVQLSTQAVDEKMRFQASKYLVERGVGLVMPGGDYRTHEKDLFQELLAKCVADYNPNG